MTYIAEMKIDRHKSMLVDLTYPKGYALMQMPQAVCEPSHAMRARSNFVINKTHKKHLGGVFYGFGLPERI